MGHMDIGRKILFLLLSCGVPFMPVMAQQGKASASVDSSSILIGDHVHLKLSYTFPSKASITWPLFTDTLTGKIDIIEKGKPDTSFSADRSNTTISQVLTITCFDNGSYYIPVVKFVHKLPGDTTNYISETQPLLLMVNTVAVDTTQAIKDIKGPLSAPLTLLELLPWIGGGILLAAIITLVIFFIIRRKKKKPLFGRAKPKIPAHVRAIEELEKLRVMHLWQAGKIKEYHTRLTDIVRSYIEERFSIAAMEMITTDLLDALENKEDMTSENYQHLRRMLQLADMVKFAKFSPLPDEHDLSHRYAVQFVNETALKEEPVQEENENIAGSGASDEQVEDKTENKEHQ
jgi:hypothetical protein